MSNLLADRWTRGLVSIVGTRIPRAAARFFPDILWRMPSTSKTAYLTFDDGPAPGGTERILEVLDRHSAKATFFLLGAKAEKHGNLVRTLHAAGHGLGNHSHTHPDAWKSEQALVLDELERTSRILEDLTGARIRYLRPPYGHFTRSIRNWCLHNEHTLTMWDVGPGDYLEVMSTQAVVAHVRAHLRPGSIVVLHDNPRCAMKTPDALDRLLRKLTNEGWAFPSLPIER